MNKQAFLLILLLIYSIFYVSAQKNWYEIKSGKIYSTVNAGGIILQQEETFDDWGNKVAIESTMGKDTFEIKTRTVYGDKIMTMIKLEKKEAVQYPRVKPRINWNELTDEVQQKYKIRYMGRVELKGYKCDLYKYTIEDNGREEEATNWVYKGIPIQYHTFNNGYELKQEFLKIDENPIIDKNIFIIPKDITLKQLQQ
ncbi:MAG: hypothetical protein Q4F97_10840 [Bacteroidales bacterium]|nr:hypothetical protein [Bacteroidales bacterium]